MTHTSKPTICLLGWAAWAPGLTTREDWLAWLPRGGPVAEKMSQPPCKGAPPLLRRRFSLPSRMLLETAIAVCTEVGVEPAATQLLHGSANGEIHALKSLLTDLSENAPLSPTAFSNSVHHVPTGHFGMVAKHTAVSRTLSAFEDSFVCAYLETLDLLRRFPQTPVLLTMADELPPQPFDRMLAVPPFPFGVTLLLANDGPAEKRLHFQRELDSKAEKGLHTEPIFDFLKWYESPQSQLRMNTGFGVVAWQKI